MSFGANSLRIVAILPLVVTRLEAQEIAVFYLFGSVLGLSTLFNRAISSSLVRAFSYAWAGVQDLADVKKVDNRDSKELDSQRRQPNYSLYEEVFSTSLYILAALNAIILVFLLFIGSVLLEKQINLLPDPEAGRHAWWILIPSVLIATSALRQSSALRGTGYIALVNRWAALFSVLTILVTSVLLLAGLKLYALAIGTLVGSIFTYFRQILLIRSTTHRQFTRSGGMHFNKQIFQVIWGPVWRQSCVAISNRGVNQSSGLILGAFLSGGGLASYLLAQRILGSIDSFAQAPFYSQIPRLCTIRAEGNMRKLASKANQALVRSQLAYILPSLIVSAILPVALGWLDSNVDFLKPEYWVLLVVFYFLERYQGMQSQVVITANIVPFWKYQIVTGLVKILLMVILADHLGVLGVILAYGLSNMMIMNWLTPYLAIKSLAESGREYFYGHIYKSLGMLILLTIGALALTKLSMNYSSL